MEGVAELRKEVIIPAIPHMWGQWLQITYANYSKRMFHLQWDANFVGSNEIGILTAELVFPQVCVGRGGGLCYFLYT